MTQPATETNPAGQAPAATQEQQPARGSQRWDGEFDSERAQRKIEALERDKAALREKAEKFEELERAKLGDVERLTADLKTATERAAKAETSLAKVMAGVNAGLTIAQSQRLSGEKPEDFEADAKAFAEELGITPSAKETPTGQEPGGGGHEEPSGKDISNHRGGRTTTPAAAAAPTQRPADATPRGGRSPEVEPEEDLAKVIAEIPR